MDIHLNGFKIKEMKEGSRRWQLDIHRERLKRKYERRNYDKDIKDINNREEVCER
jgi:hypothetical protein